MFFIHAKLLKIDSKPDQKTGQMNHRLIFKSQKFDRGLEEMVDCSLPVKLHEDHFHLVESYKCYQGREVYIPISIVGVDGNVYYKTAGDGKPKDLQEKQPILQKAV